MEIIKEVFSTRLHSLYDKRKLTWDQMGELVVNKKDEPKTGSLIRRYAKGLSTPTSIEGFQKLVEYFGKSLEWLAGHEYGLDGVKRIPVHDVDILRTNVSLRDIADNRRPDGFIEVKEFESGDIVVRNTGAQMHGLIRDGGYIILKMLQEWSVAVEPGSAHYIETDIDDMRLIRYISSFDENEYKLSAYNKSFIDTKISKSRVCDIHKIIGTISSI